MAEEYRMGGTCVIRGCVPKKLLVYASISSRDRGRSGLRLDHSAGDFDWPTLIANKDREIARLEAPIPQRGKIRRPHRQDPRGVRGRPYAPARDQRGRDGKIC